MRLVIMILFDPNKGTYHAALFREAWFPGPVEDAPSVVRLKSQSHHTAGATTLEGAQVQVDELAKARPDAIVLRDRVAAFDSDDPAVVLLLNPSELAA